GQQVCIDMEDKSVTDATLRIYRFLRDKGLDNVSTVVQAYMRRTPDDVEKLIKDGYKPNLRICKGIYKADRDFKTMKEINDNYIRTAKLMADNGCYVGLASHDLPLIRRIRQEVIEPAKLTPDKFEWQMLLGVPVEKRQDELIAQGDHVRIYIPFGPPADAAAYCRRRFKENPKMFFFILKNMFYRK
ncbi:MAG: proline dehydrogenase family protein, partial [Candidatus Brocadiia bacterium]